MILVLLILNSQIPAADIIATHRNFSPFHFILSNNVLSMYPAVILLNIHDIFALNSYIKLMKISIRFPRNKEYDFIKVKILFTT